MSQAREVRNKIASIKNTQKITRAMELVAASKMRRAQELMKASKPYSDRIRAVIRHVAQSNSEFDHPYLVKREQIHRVGYIVVTSDRGLCGGLNINLLRKLILDMKQWSDKQVEIDLCLIGRKGATFFKHYGGNIIASADHIGDTPEIKDLIGIVKLMLDRFDKASLDAIYIVGNEFVNTMQQKPYIRQLLPLPMDDKASELECHWDYIYEPDEAKTLMTLLLQRYIESQVYQAVVENLACFQAAQMVAMKSATDNAGGIIEELQLIYNKARQASITQEIAEIVAGAEAID